MGERGTKGTTGRGRIALVHPTYWPEVRRGSERVIHDLAEYLAERGFEPTVVTGRRARPERTVEDGFVVERGWRPPGRLQPPGLEPYANHALVSLLQVARGGFDLVHAFYLPHAAAAAVWSRFARWPLVVSLMGFPDARSVAAYRGRAQALRYAASRARGLHVLSEAARVALLEATGFDATVIHPGTRTSDFAVHEPKAPEPTVFCASSPVDPRKRVGKLLAEFAELRRDLPKARLVVTGPVPAELRQSMHDAGAEALSESIGQDTLRRAYARSWVTVLPSTREGFGQVLVESLAAGTPVVALRSGAASEIVDGPEVGVLCDGEAPGLLAAALREALALAERPGTRDACRTRARAWDWSVVGPRFEAMYARAMCSVSRG